MQRLIFSFASIFALAAGCSSTNPYFAGDGGTEGGSVVGDDVKPKDGGIKKDGNTTTDDDGDDTPDASVKADASKPKADVFVPPTDTCAPGSISGWTPQWKAPAAFHQNKCSATQAEALLCLFDANADQSTCANLVDDPANDDCFKCIYTASSSAAPGPVIITGSLGSLNIAGCIARATNDVTSTGCGAKVQAADQCGDEACDANCPVPEGDDAALDARNKCTEDAGFTVCSTYSTAAQCAETLLDVGGAADECAQGQDFLERAVALAKLFCVP